SAQIREILISESAWEEMTCLFAPSLSTSTGVHHMMRTCMIAVGNILFLFHYSFLNALSSFIHAVNKVIPAAFIVG
ncbi:hypothetical protein QQX80_18000, partial [Klebsiella quasipneumoniae]|nr:hypothetical protein [Klebsiella quasipneumoniae]